MKHIIFSIFIVFLFGTTAYTQNIQIIDYFLSECDDSTNQCIVQPRIIYEVFENDTLKVAFNIVENCSGFYNLKAEKRNDSLFLSYTAGEILDTVIENGEVWIIEGEAECDCCFEFTANFKALNNKPKHYVLNGKEMHLFENKYKLFPVEYEIIGSDTVNYKDKYGRMQGKWFGKNKNSHRIYSTWKDGVRFQSFEEYYYKTGVLKSKEIRTFFINTRYIEYFETGKIKRDTTIND